MDTIKKTNFFVDTSKSLQMAHCQGDVVQLNLQPAGINCGDDENIRLVLKQFSMYKTWSNININNKTFRIVTPTATDDVILTIPEANYSSIKDIVQAFALAVSNQLIVEAFYSSATITVNNPTGTDIDDNTDNIIDVTITTNTTHGLTSGDLVIKCPITDGDFYTIIGGDRINDTNGITESLIVTFPDTTSINIKGLYPAQTTSEAYIYLRTDIQNDSLQTAALISGNTDTVGTITQSQILAKIPLDRTIISYDAQTDEFFINVDTKHLTHAELRLTDSYGRPLPQKTNQATSGNLNFNCVVEIQILRNRFANPNKIQGQQYTDMNSKQSGFLNALNHGDTRVYGFNK